MATALVPFEHSPALILSRILLDLTTMRDWCSVAHTCRSLHQHLYGKGPCDCPDVTVPFQWHFTDATRTEEFWQHIRALDRDRTSTHYSRIARMRWVSSKSVSCMRLLLLTTASEPTLLAQHYLEMASKHAWIRATEFLVNSLEPRDTIGRIDVHILIEAVRANRATLVGALLRLPHASWHLVRDEALREACTLGARGCVEQLLLNVSKIPSRTCCAALYAAMRAGHNDIMWLLLRDAHVRSARGLRFVFRMACEDRNVSLIRTLLAIEMPHTTEDYFDGWLHLCREGNVGLLQVLIASPRVAPAAHSNEGLSEACRHRRMGAVRRLLSDNRIRALVHESAALVSASTEGNTAIVQALLAVPGRLSATIVRNARTLAQRKGHLGVVALLDDVPPTRITAP